MGFLAFGILRPSGTKEDLKLDGSVLLTSRGVAGTYARSTLKTATESTQDRTAGRDIRRHAFFYGAKEKILGVERRAAKAYATKSNPDA